MSNITPLRATIDIGSNTVLLLAGETTPFKELAKLSEVTSLGKGLDKTGVFSEESMTATFKALTSYRSVCNQLGIKPEDIITTATDAARVAKNSREFFEKIRSELGINVLVITGQAEAELTTKGILLNTSFNIPEVVVMDIGGASTELIRVNTESQSAKSLISLPVGSVRVADWLGESTFDARLGHIFTTNSNALDSFSTETLYCVAGTLTSLANMHLGHKVFEENEVHGMRMKTEEIDELLQRFGGWSPEQFLDRFPFLGKRAHAILGGMTLVHHMLHRLKVKDVVVSTYGLRYGTFLEGRIKHDYLA